LPDYGDGFHWVRFLDAVLPDGLPAREAVTS
jgi:hypothetical protein